MLMIWEVFVLYSFILRLSVNTRFNDHCVVWIWLNILLYCHFGKYYYNYYWLMINIIKINDICGTLLILSHLSIGLLILYLFYYSFLTYIFFHWFASIKSTWIESPSRTAAKKSQSNNVCHADGFKQSIIICISENTLYL